MAVYKNTTYFINMLRFAVNIPNSYFQNKSAEPKLYAFIIIMSCKSTIAQHFLQQYPTARW